MYSVFINYEKHVGKCQPASRPRRPRHERSIYNILLLWKRRENQACHNTTSSIHIINLRWYYHHFGTNFFHNQSGNKQPRSETKNYYIIITIITIGPLLQFFLKRSDTKQHILSKKNHRVMVRISVTYEIWGYFWTGQL